MRLDERAFEEELLPAAVLAIVEGKAEPVIVGQPPRAVEDVVLLGRTAVGLGLGAGAVDEAVVGVDEDAALDDPARLEGIAGIADHQPVQLIKLIPHAWFVPLHPGHHAFGPPGMSSAWGGMPPSFFRQ